MKKTEVEASVLEEQPGYFIRRLQQIAVAVFLEETQTLAITPVQYAALGAVSPGGVKARQAARDANAAIRLRRLSFSSARGS